MPLWAQKYTQAEIQGKWKLVTYITSEATLDLTTGKATVDDIVAAKYGPEYTAELIKKTEALTEKLRLSYLEIDGAKFALLVNDVVRSGTYKIKKDKKNKQIIQATFLDTSQSTVPFIMKDGNIVLENYFKDHYIFEREQ
jgi:hypothetical protein